MESILITVLSIVLLAITVVLIYGFSRIIDRQSDLDRYAKFLQTINEEMEDAILFYEQLRKEYETLESEN